MQVDLHEHAAEDLWQLKMKDRNAAAAVAVILEQIEADPLAIDKLTTHGDNQVGEKLLNVKRWESVRRRPPLHHGDLWRFRILNTAATNYRVVYGYRWQTRQICVLAIVHKDSFDYDDHSSDLAKRILADWRAI